MKRSVLIDGIDEQVDVDDDHFRNESFLISSSSSIAAAVSSALSHRKFCSRPKENVFCTKERPFDRACVKPILTAEFKASLKEIPRSFIALCSRATTSGSRVVVVLKIGRA